MSELIGKNPKLQPEYWEGKTIHDGGELTDYPEYGKGEIAFARESVRAVLGNPPFAIPHEPVAIFEHGTTFDSSAYQPGTVVNLTVESLIGPLGNNLALFIRKYWASVVKSKDKAPGPESLLIGFNEWVEHVGYSNREVRRMNYGISPVPFPVSFRIGEIWRDQVSSVGNIEELRKATRLEVIAVGQQVKRDVRERNPLRRLRLVPSRFSA